MGDQRLHAHARKAGRNDRSGDRVRSRRRHAHAEDECNHGREDHGKELIGPGDRQNELGETAANTGQRDNTDDDAGTGTHRDELDAVTRRLLERLERTPPAEQQCGHGDESNRSGKRNGLRQRRQDVQHERRHSKAETGQDDEAHDAAEQHCRKRISAVRADAAVGFEVLEPEGDRTADEGRHDTE